MGKEEGAAEGTSRQECINSSNPFHECSHFCLRKIEEAKRCLDDEWKRPPEERTVHPDCINTSNPYHDCSEYCFKTIADAKLGSERGEQEPPAGGSGKSDVALDQADGDAGRQEDAGADDGYLQMIEKQKKLFELRRADGMNEARKANQQAMVAEKKRMEPRPESRGVSKQKWLEDRKKKIGKLLDSNGLDLSKSFMLDTQESAEAKYKKWEKEPAPYEWDDSGVRAKLDRIMASDYYIAQPEMRATVDVAAAVGKYGAGDVQAQESMVVSPEASAPEESLPAEGHKKLQDQFRMLKALRHRNAVLLH